MMRMELFYLGFYTLLYIQKIGVHLVAHHLVWNNELDATLVFSIYCYHSEIEEKTQEIIRVVNVFGREILHKLACYKSLGYKVLDDAGIMREVLVVTDEHTQLIVIHPNI